MASRGPRGQPESAPCAGSHGRKLARRGQPAEAIIGKSRGVEIELAKGPKELQACRTMAVPEQTYCRWRKEFGVRSRLSQDPGTGLMGPGHAHHAARGRSHASPRLCLKTPEGCVARSAPRSNVA